MHLILIISKLYPIKTGLSSAGGSGIPNKPLKETTQKGKQPILLKIRTQEFSSYE